MSKRIKTNYPGVYYREARRIGCNGIEKVFYIVFKKAGKVHEEKAGRQFADDMTPARAAGLRAERIENKRPSRKQLRQEAEARKLAIANRWTIDRLWDEYESQRPDSKSLRTDKNRYENHLKGRFGAKEPKDLIQLDVDRLRINLLKKRKPQTVKHILALLKRVINFGVKKGLCPGAGFIIELPKVNNLKTEDLNQDQLTSLLNAINTDTNIQAANMMRMVLYTGMRRGELFNLQWEHIDFERGFIHIKEPKGGINQKIPLNRAAKELLINHPHSDSPYVFPGRNGNKRTDINHQVNRIKNRAGLPENFRPLHGLRHVYASMLASTGEVDMYTLQKLLTHKHPNMTQRYAHLRDDALKRASNIVDRLMNEQTAIKKNQGA
jgi:integrase